MKCAYTRIVVVSLIFFVIPALTTPSPRIAIVGAGIAGLTAAYRLNQLGYPAYVYEGSERIGGRINSAQFPNGQIYERGAELISASDEAIIALAAELNVSLYEQFPGSYPPGAVPFTEVVEYPDPDFPLQKSYRETSYPYAEINYDWLVRVNPNTGRTIFDQMTLDANNSYPLGNPGVTTPWPIVYPNPTFTAQLDNMSLDEYIDNLCSFLRTDGNGSKSKLAQYFKVRMAANNGAEPINQSPLINFLWEIIFGASGASLHVNGGNSRLIEVLVDYLEQSDVATPILLNYRLTKVTLRTDLSPIDIYGNYPYQLTFDTPNGLVVQLFDHIILANPFVTYRQSDNPNYLGYWIDISQAGFSDLKQYAIQNLPMGISSKTNVQFKNRFWRDLGNNGFNLATSNPAVSNQPERLYQSTWEASSGQAGKTGILIDLRAGENAIPILNSAAIKDVRKHNKYLKEITQCYLKQLNFNLPGATSCKNFKFRYAKGREDFKKCCKKIVNVDTSNRFYIPWTRGGYPYTAPGQILGGTGQIIDGQVVPAGAVVPFWGYCGVPEPYTINQTGNCHFAGDGTTFNQIGYMNSAVTSGNRVVIEIVNDLV